MGCFMIGINLAPISPAYQGVSKDEYIKDMVNLVKALQHEEIVFITHDYHIGKSIGKLRDTSDLSPIDEVNQYFNYQLINHEEIRRCSLIITFRMHLAIRAVCVGIRTIYLGYYDKKWCIPQVSHFIHLDYRRDMVVGDILAGLRILRANNIGWFELTSDRNIEAIKLALEGKI